MRATKQAEAILPLGHVVITANANAVLDKKDVAKAIKRHEHGDWGDVSKETWKQNDNGIAYGERILSEYRDSKKTKFFVITEWDRSVTTVLLPADY